MEITTTHNDSITLPVLPSELNTVKVYRQAQLQRSVIPQGQFSTALKIGFYTLPYFDGNRLKVWLIKLVKNT